MEFDKIQEDSVPVEKHGREQRKATLDSSTKICDSEFILRWLAQTEKYVLVETIVENNIEAGDNHESCSSMAKRTHRLSPLNLEKLLHEPPERRRRKSSRDSSLIEELTGPSLDAGAKATTCESSRRDERKRPLLKRSSELEVTTSEASSISLRQKHDFFVKRARYKTREDRYDVNRKHPTKAKTLTKRTKKPQNQRRESDRNTRKRQTNYLPKSDFDGVVKNFSSKIFEQDRLTIRPSHGLGLFKNGRASSPAKRRSVPDMTFSEMDFLQNSKPESQPKHKKSTKCYSRGVEKVRSHETREEMSTYFRSSVKTQQEVNLRSQSKSIPPPFSDEQNSNAGKRKELGHRRDQSNSLVVREKSLDVEEAKSLYPTLGSTDKRKIPETNINLSHKSPECALLPEIKLGPVDLKEGCTYESLIDIKPKLKCIETRSMSHNGIKNLTNAASKTIGAEIPHKLLDSGIENSIREVKNPNPDVEEIGTFNVEENDFGTEGMKNKIEDRENFNSCPDNERNNNIKQNYVCHNLYSDSISKNALLISDTDENSLQTHEPLSTSYSHGNIVKKSSKEYPVTTLLDTSSSQPKELSETRENESQSYSNIDKIKLQSSIPTVCQGLKCKSSPLDSGKASEITAGFQNTNDKKRDYEVHQNDTWYSEGSRTCTTPGDKITTEENNQTRSAVYLSSIDSKERNLINTTDSMFMPLNSKINIGLNTYPQTSWVNRPFQSTRLETVIEEETQDRDNFFLFRIPPQPDCVLDELGHETQLVNTCPPKFLGNLLPIHTEENQENKSREMTQPFHSYFNPLVNSDYNEDLAHLCDDNELIYFEDSPQITPHEDTIDADDLMDDNLDEDVMETDTISQNRFRMDSCEDWGHSRSIEYFDSNLSHGKKSVEDFNSLSNFWSVYRQY